MVEEDELLDNLDQSLRLLVGEDGQFDQRVKIDPVKRMVQGTSSLLRLVLDEAFLELAKGFLVFKAGKRGSPRHCQGYIRIWNISVAKLVERVAPVLLTNA